MSEPTLKDGEPHPTASIALSWLNAFKMADLERWMNIREAIASTSLTGNRLAEICNSTLQRLENNEPVSDRYLLGLCWFIRDNFEYE